MTGSSEAPSSYLFLETSRIYASTIEGGSLPAWWERECPSHMSLSCPCLSSHVPSHMSLSSLPLELPVQLLLSPTLFLLTCLLRLLPTQVSCPVVPPPHTLGVGQNCRSLGLCLWEAGGSWPVSCFRLPVPAAGWLFLPPPSSAPTPSSSHSFSPVART